MRTRSADAEKQINVFSWRMLWPKCFYFRWSDLHGQYCLFFVCLFVCLQNTIILKEVKKKLLTPDSGYYSSLIFFSLFIYFHFSIKSGSELVRCLCLIVWIISGEMILTPCSIWETSCPTFGPSWSSELKFEFNLFLRFCLCVRMLFAFYYAQTVVLLKDIEGGKVAQSDFFGSEMCKIHFFRAALQIWVFLWRSLNQTEENKRMKDNCVINHMLCLWNLNFMWWVCWAPICAFFLLLIQTG